VKPFVDKTEALGAEKWVTVSTLTPLLHKVLDVYLRLSADDDRVVISMKEAMYHDLSSRYHGTQCVILNKAAF